MRKQMNFYIDGESASDRGIIMQDVISFDAPVPRTEKVQVPGRNGDIIFFDGSYQNVKGTVPCAVRDDKDISLKISKINEWLHPDGRYRRLETESEPETFRMARITHGVQFHPRRGRINIFEIEFDCRPQRFIKFGEYAVELENGQKLINPTIYAALPLLTVTCSSGGILHVGDDTITITGYTGTITIDSEEMDCYSGAENLNEYVSGPFPKLRGETTFSWSGGISAVSVIPRWFDI